MGNYYAGMMNNTGGYGELRHHGILGQKWGVRRFQNADGSLTDAGRERYYGNPGEQQKLLKLLHKTPRDVKTIKQLPWIRDAATKLQENDLGHRAAKARMDFDEAYEEAMHQVYDGGSKVYEKWLNRAVDNYMKDHKDDPGGSREDIYNWFKYDDGDQNEQGVLETYARESNEPAAKRYREAEKEDARVSNELFNKSREYAKKMLGEKATSNDEVILTSFIADAAKEYHAGKIPASSKEGEKDFKRYMRLQGTKSLLGGDHSHDASVKALTDYHNELYSKRKELKSIANRKGKDQYRDSVQKIAEKHIDKYAKAVLKDMGYDTTDATIAWLKKQPWFYMRGANDIVF